MIHRVWCWASRSGPRSTPLAESALRGQTNPCGIWRCDDYAELATNKEREVRPMLRCCRSLAYKLCEDSIALLYSSPRGERQVSAEYLRCRRISSGSWGRRLVHLYCGYVNPLRRWMFSGSWGWRLIRLHCGYLNLPLRLCFEDLGLYIEHL